MKQSQNDFDNSLLTFKRILLFFIWNTFCYEKSKEVCSLRKAILVHGGIPDIKK